MRRRAMADTTGIRHLRRGARLCRGTRHGRTGASASGAGARRGVLHRDQHLRPVGAERARPAARRLRKLLPLGSYRRLLIELTETAEIQDIAAAAATLDEFRAQGISV